jgi:serine/threonine protein kinase
MLACSLLSPMKSHVAGRVTSQVVEMQVGCALDYLHRHPLGICNRDVKLENILVFGHDAQHCDGKPRPYVKLSDFGFCKSQYASRTRLERTRLGTSYYVAPEVFGLIPCVPAAASSLQRHAEAVHASTSACEAPHACAGTARRGTLGQRRTYGRQESCCTPSLQACGPSMKSRATPLVRSCSALRARSMWTASLSTLPPTAQVQSSATCCAACWSSALRSASACMRCGRRLHRRLIISHEQRVSMRVKLHAALCGHR